MRSNHFRFLLSICSLAVGILGVAAISANAASTQADTGSERLRGRILLQVEGKGEAWYVNPKDETRHYLGRPSDAFRVMREQGLGITNADLERITLSSENKARDAAFAKKLAGRVLLQVQGSGEAWYVYPVDLKRYYLGRPADAFRIMRELGLGISDANLSTIPTGEHTLTGEYWYSVGSGDLHGGWEEYVDFRNIKSDDLPIESPDAFIQFRDPAVTKLFEPKGSKGTATIVVRDFIRNTTAAEMGDGAAFVMLVSKEERPHAFLPEPPYRFYRDGVNPMRALSLDDYGLDSFIQEGDDIDSDEDGDGLVRILEELYGTDPNKADTDGDGFDDKTEAVKGYDPTKGNGVQISRDTQLAQKIDRRFFTVYGVSDAVTYWQAREGMIRYLGRNEQQVRNILDSARVSDEFADMKSIPFTIMASGVWRGIKKDWFHAIYSQEDFEEAWKELFPGREPIPQLDFSTNMVVLYFGSRGVTEMSIQEVELYDQERKMSIRFTQVTADESCPLTLSQAFQMVLVKRIDGVFGSGGSGVQDAAKTCPPSDEAVVRYENRAHRFALLLPEQLSVFKVTEGAGSDPREKFRVVFSQYSIKEGRYFPVFGVTVMSNEAWALIEHDDDFEIAKAGSFGVERLFKIGANETDTFARLDIFPEPSDHLPSYVWRGVEYKPL